MNRTYKRKEGGESAGESATEKTIDSIDLSGVLFQGQGSSPLAAEDTTGPTHFLSAIRSENCYPFGYPFGSPEVPDPTNRGTLAPSHVPRMWSSGVCILTHH